MDPTIVAAIISASATVLAALIPRVRILFSVPPLALGAFVTGVVAFIGLVVQLGAIDQGLRVLEDQLDDSVTIADLPDEPPIPAADEIDRHARAIIDGAGPDEWPMPDGRTIDRGDVLYTRGGGSWFDVVFPNDDCNDRFRVCVPDDQGRLTVRGFSTERTAALVEYAPPPAQEEEGGAGLSCGAGTFFFYPAPPLPE